MQNTSGFMGSQGNLIINRDRLVCMETSFLLDSF